MKRRNFLRNGGLATAALGIPLTTKTPRALPNLKAKKLKKGDTVGVISPGSYVSDKGLEKGVKNLERLGLKVKLSKNIRAQRGFTAGTDQERLDDLHTMFSDDDIAAIWCARGGYGCTRLLPYINYDLIRNNPKILIGYSDITALLQAIYVETGLIGFHGAVASSDFTRYTKKHLKQVLFEDKEEVVIELSKANQRKGNKDAIFEAKTIFRGSSRGKLMGGNLSLLSAMAGTKWALDARNKLVFIEEIGEKPYRVDRMLTQLRQSANLHLAKGIVLGVFKGCEAKKGDLSLSLEATLTDRLSDYRIPVAYGLSFGHIANQCVLPIGIEASFDADTQQLTLLEPAVI